MNRQVDTNAGAAIGGRNINTPLHSRQWSCGYSRAGYRELAAVGTTTKEDRKRTDSTELREGESHQPSHDGDITEGLGPISFVIAYK